MKTKSLVKLLVGITLAASGAFAFGSAVSHKKVETVTAGANDKHFFLDCTGCTGWDSESVCIHTWNGSSDVYVEATKVSEDYWSVVLDTTGCSGYRWYRCAKGNTGTRWNESGWNGTISNNYCSIKGYDSDATFSGSTNGCEESYEVASTAPSTTTKRVWVNPKTNFYDGNARAALRVFNGGTHYKTYVLGGSSQYKTVSGQTLFYVDIPSSYDCQLVRLHNAFNFIWTYGGNFSSISEYNTAKVVYSWAADASYSAANEETATVDYAKAVLDGYSTCLSSSVNGYGCYTNINTQVLSKLSPSDFSSLRSATFSASGYGSRTYGEKIDRMSNNGNPSGSARLLLPVINENSNTIAIIVVISLVSVTAIGGFFFIRKRREN